MEEATSSTRHPLDIQSARSLLADPEVEAWLEQMDALALLPVKR